MVNGVSFQSTEKGLLFESKFSCKAEQHGTSWLYNIQQCTINDSDHSISRSGIACYFVSAKGSTFHINIPFQPYFYVEVDCQNNYHPSQGSLAEVESLIRKRAEGVSSIEVVQKEDLDKPNHLVQGPATFLKVSFNNVTEYGTAVKEVQKLARDEYLHLTKSSKHIKRLREFDIPLAMRATIDLGIRVGFWYDISYLLNIPKLTLREDLVERAQLRILAYDIETTKQPLKFPDVKSDVIMMISYMIDGHGAKVHDLSFEEVSGFRNVGTGNSKEYVSPQILHLDCFYWVKRDSYLPQGSQGLKAVTKAKLGYDPYEVDPELMVKFAKEKPKYMASYAVSDAVSTYYLYMKYIHGFIFSLCNIVPYPPDDVLRKGSGSLCEALLLARAFSDNIIAPDKQIDLGLKLAENGNIIDTETYVGAKVEALTSGIFRSDLPISFDCDSAAFQELIDNIDRDLKFALTEEGKIDLADVTNYEEVKSSIITELLALKEQPSRTELPLIYHLDVGAMYPNIILTNRLQPCSVVSEERCAGCEFNTREAKCKRKMQWVWRGNIFPLNKSDFIQVQDQLSQEDPTFTGKSDNDRATLLRKRLSLKARKSHTSIHNVVETVKDVDICQKENPFYVNTVGMFRDRRYEYKVLQKQWKKKIDSAKDAIERENAKNMVIIFDSLQLAHKCILNSFYGYVMRAGSRWHSIEMAGVVTLTGVNIITRARKLVDRIGKPLELDTDGIWCVFPRSFPENFSFSLSNGKSYSISYPCVMLNADCFSFFTNSQYHHQVLGTDGKPLYTMDGLPRYEIKPECSIAFEVDGPYKAMVLPASTEEGKLLKKRYAVFNEDGSLAELKGFEIKRRGELQIIKQFQSQVFKVFLEGTTTEECYKAVGEVANSWLDILHTKGANISDEQVIELLSESKNMSKSLHEYGDQKSAAITTAKKLADFLGPSIIEDSSLTCKFFISRFPGELPVAERAVPIVILSAEPALQREFLRRWCGVLSSYEIKFLIDWDYYFDRFSATVRRIITIPAALQGVSNPCPLVAHPLWLTKMLSEKRKSKGIVKISSFFQAGAKRLSDGVEPPTKTSEVVNVEDQDLVVDVDVEHKEKVNLLDLRSSDFYEYLKELKSSWRDKIEKRRLRHLNFKKSKLVLPQGAVHSTKVVQKLEREARLNKDLSTAALHPSSAPKAYLSVEERMANETWFLLSLVPVSDGSDGNFTAWVVIGGSLFSVSMEVPRIIYCHAENDAIDFKSLELNLSTRKVFMTPPKGFSESEGSNQKASEVLEISMPESSYTKLQDQIATWKYSPKIFGIYEQDVPLQFRAIVELGSCFNCTQPLRQNLIRSERRLNSMFHLKEFEMNNKGLNTGEVPFPLENLSTIFLAFFQCGARTVTGIFSNRFKKYLIYFSTISMTSTVSHFSHSDVVAVDSMFNGWSGEVKTAKSIDEIFKKFEGFLGDEMMYNQGPDFSILIKQGDQLQSKFTSAGYFPSFQYQCHLKIYQLSHHQISLRGWKLDYDSPRVIARIEASAVIGIPAGNLSPDIPLQTSDVYLARLLKKDNHLLWTSLDSDQNLTFKSLLTSSNAVKKVDFIPGLFRSWSAEVRLYGFVANAITSFTNGTQTSSLLNTPESSAIVSSPAFVQFELMVKFVKFCFSRYKTNSADAKYCGEILKNLGRIIASQTSVLYDPELLSLVTSVTDTSKDELVSIIQKTGGSVLYFNNDSSTLRICTAKASIDRSEYWMENLQDIISSPQKNFKYLTIKILQYIAPLVQLDESSHFGLVSDGGYISNFYLLNDPMFSEVSDYVRKMIIFYLSTSRKLLDLVDHYQISGEVKDVNIPFDLVHFLSLVSIKEDVDENSRLGVGAMRAMFGDFFKNTNFNFKNILFGLCKEMKRKYARGNSLASRLIFLICYVLEFDPAIQPILSNFKQLLVDVLDIDSPADIDTNTSSLVLQLVCTRCLATCPIDICRETWMCRDCQCRFDDDYIESELVKQLNNCLTLYHRQDFVCSRCNLGAHSLVTNICHCQGNLTGSVSTEDVLEFIKPFKTIAKMQNVSMEFLNETLAYFII
ncbi:hypothetical protein GEMRC1_004040 [Eukaryota sp. GEM-RC1]